MTGMKCWKALGLGVTEGHSVPPALRFQVTNVAPVLEDAYTAVLIVEVEAWRMHFDLGLFFLPVGGLMRMSSLMRETPQKTEPSADSLSA